jgi:hypothetical protein
MRRPQKHAHSDFHGWLHTSLQENIELLILVLPKQGKNEKAFFQNLPVLAG